MRIRSNTITPDDVRRAFELAREIDGQDIQVLGIRSFRPRKFRYGTEVTGYAYEGRYASGANPNHRAASWQAWGYVIAYLFNMDQGAEIGIYKSRQVFERDCLVWGRFGKDTSFLRILETDHELLPE